MHPSFDVLIKAGLLRFDGISSSIGCDECSTAHDAEVVFEGERYGYYCSELGFVELDRENLVTVAPDIATFVTQLADNLNCGRRKTSPIQGDVWRIGAIETSSGQVTCYFQPTSQNMQDMNELESALSQEMTTRFGIVLTAAGGLSKPPLKTIPLQDCIVFDLKTRGFVVDADLCAAAGVPVLRKGGRPNEHKESVMALFERRIANGHTLGGLNEEASALMADFKIQFPDRNCPSLSTVKRYITAAKAGS